MKKNLKKVLLIIGALILAGGSFLAYNEVMRKRYEAKLKANFKALSDQPDAANLFIDSGDYDNVFPFN